MCACILVIVVLMTTDNARLRTVRFVPHLLSLSVSHMCLPLLVLLFLLFLLPKSTIRNNK